MSMYKVFILDSPRYYGIVGRTSFHVECLNAWEALAVHVGVRRDPVSLAAARGECVNCYCSDVQIDRFVIQCERGLALVGAFQAAERLMRIEAALMNSGAEL